MLFSSLLLELLLHLCDGLLQISCVFPPKVLEAILEVTFDCCYQFALELFQVAKINKLVNAYKLHSLRSRR